MWILYESDPQGNRIKLGRVKSASSKIHLADSSAEFFYNWHVIGKSEQLSGSSFAWLTYIPKLAADNDNSLNSKLNVIYDTPGLDLFHLGKQNAVFLDGHAASRTLREFRDRWYEWFPYEPNMPFSMR